MNKKADIFDEILEIPKIKVVKKTSKQRIQELEKQVDFLNKEIEGIKRTIRRMGYGI